ncbi:AraC family transcriptional regulator [Puteibacter caeruleilacunae]|nr:AraC family transcriptional regulator [Puteibacter caeruleilacunae]
MNLLNIIPIIGASWGILFSLFIVTNKNIHANNRKAKSILVLIILLLTHNLIDSYYSYNNFETMFWSGYSYLHYHLVGYLILLYTSSLLKLTKVLKGFHFFIIMVTIVRFVALSMLIDGEDSFKQLATTSDILILDYLIALFSNIIPLIRLYFKLRKMKFAVKLVGKSKTEFIWLRNIIGLSILIYLAIFQSNIVSVFWEKEWFFFMKIESLITSFFFFGFAVLAIRFPVFTIQGDYEELQTSRANKKYAKSSLKSDTSEQLWEKITDVMDNRKLWQNPEIRLNNLAEEVNETVHHVSQVINERKQLNFFDFINQYRINEARELLTTEKGKHFKILAIAFEVGFNSKTTFYTAFKKETGLTPSEYRKIHNKL